LFRQLPLSGPQYLGGALVEWQKNVSACGNDDQNTTLKIAMAGPITGDVAQYGEMQMTGGKMAVHQINAAGGVLGKTLEAVIYDDACDPKQAVAVANKIVNDNIKFVLGHLCSSSTQPASDIYEDSGILMITAASTSPDITTVKA
jgi:branched-chain amino acid transport system substrate-binding protein